MSKYTARPYRRDDGKYDWIIREQNGQVVGGSMNQGYENLGDCVDMMHQILDGSSVEILDTPA